MFAKPCHNCTISLLLLYKYVNTSNIVGITFKDSHGTYTSKNISKRDFFVLFDV